MTLPTCSQHTIHEPYCSDCRCRAALAAVTRDHEALRAAAQAMVDKLERLQDAIDRALPVPGRRLLPRDQRESAEHKALRAALRAALPAPAATRDTTEGDDE